MNILENVVCPECGGFMTLDQNPEFMKCSNCDHQMSIDEVKGAEEDPLDFLE
jgi:DNA-directed RNA polymerase subunit M/transcription elongation factor TFIIS